MIQDISRIQLLIQIRLYYKVLIIKMVYNLLILKYRLLIKKMV